MSDETSGPKKRGRKPVWNAQNDGWILARQRVDREIASEVGTSAAVVRRRRIALGLPPVRRHGKDTHEIARARSAAVVAAWDVIGSERRGSIGAAARACGVSRERARQILAAAGRLGDGERGVAELPAEAK